jgi:peptidyl-prolyl isomerase E (cyclophilin E)
MPRYPLYVGGLADEVSEALLKAAFLPFGECVAQIPVDNKSGKHKGFGFVEFQDEQDAASAIENMHGAELAGRVLRVNAAVKGVEKGASA